MPKTVTDKLVQVTVKVARSATRLWIGNADDSRTIEVKRSLPHPGTEIEARGSAAT